MEWLTAIGKGLLSAGKWVVAILGWKVIVGIILVAGATYLIVKVMKAGADKLTKITIEKIIRESCLESNQGELSYDAALDIPEISWIDIATHGFSLRAGSLKVKFSSGGHRRCKYHLEREWVDEEGNVTTQQSQEYVVERCPT